MEKERSNIPLAHVSLSLEMVFVTVALVLLIRFLQSDPSSYEAWPAVPFLLLSAAIVPTFLRRKKFSAIGFHLEQPGLSLRVLCMVCFVVFPALFCGILLFKYYKIPLPLSPDIPEKRWLSWLVYQFLCVAVAEETFFRGYLQSNIQYLLTLATQKNAALAALTSVIISSIAFAIFHSIIFGNIISIITFLPGLIFGWLFLKTKSLFAPILFHGLANAGYGFLIAVLT